MFKCDIKNFYSEEDFIGYSNYYYIDRLIKEIMNIKNYKSQMIELKDSVRSILKLEIFYIRVDDISNGILFTTYINIDGEYISNNCNPILLLDLLAEEKTVRNLIYNLIIELLDMLSINDREDLMFSLYGIKEENNV